MEKNKQEEEVKALCSAEFLESLKTLGERNLTAAIRHAGYDEGYVTGYNKGYEAGHEEGCLDAEQKVAQKMLKAGLSIKTIEECTSLTEEDIEELL